MESRQIKFRAWLPHEGKMTHSHTLKKIVEICSLGYPSDSIWLQYTGLKDKNGVEIYEGDILRTDINNKLWRISFINYSWHVTNVKEKYSLGLYLSMLMRTGANLEVFGNVHQNPELL